jgi:hypothetical protein
VQCQHYYTAREPSLRPIVAGVFAIWIDSQIVASLLQM